MTNGCALPGCTVNHREPTHEDGHGVDWQGGTDDVAWDRKETDPCEKGTQGCSVAHTREGASEECQSW